IPQFECLVAGPARATLLVSLLRRLLGAGRSLDPLGRILGRIKKPVANRDRLFGASRSARQPLSAVTTTSIKAPPPRPATPTLARAGRLSPKNSVQTASISF